MDMSVFWLVYIGIGIILAILFVIKYGYPTGTQTSVTFSFGEAKEYFFTKHYCKHCNTQLKRSSTKAFKGKGWSKSAVDGEFMFGEKYDMKFSLKCPNCNANFNLNEVG
ncbi:hypothetical protein [Paenibacillus albus]|uniref:Uncharacterized protein n=1 Tax=Paenibacillus albus TaxID=2495582 RepID=A0A3S9A762_9BACL|nr:hypothetical protein [Paenibacillus albus]AZN41629.1 hypothetical protein EJC50_19570 [Paenibacillus albus]